MTRRAALLLACALPFIAAAAARADRPASADSPTSAPTGTNPTGPAIERIVAASQPAPPVALNPLTLPPEILAEIPSAVMAPLVAAADGRTLRGFDVSGTLVDPRGDLVASLANDLRPGEPFDVAMAERLAYKLWQLDYVPTPALLPANDGVRLALELAPALIVRHVKVRYPDHPIESRLYSPLFDQDLLARMPLHAGSILPAGEALGDAVATAEKTLTDYLVTQGYYDAEVSVEVRHGDQPNEAELLVSLRRAWPGEAYAIGAITSVGNHAVTDAEIAHALTHHHWYYSARYNKEDLREEIDGLVQLYHERGYPYARIDFPGIVADRATRTLDLTLHVHEGRHVDVHFLVDGAEVVSRELRSATTIFSSGSADEYALADSATGLVHYFQARGDPEAEVTYDRTSDAAGDERIDFHIRRGPELVVRAVRILGNRAIGADVILPRLNTQVYGLFHGGYVTAEGLIGDAKTIAQLYHDRGFVEAQVSVRIATDGAALDAPGAIAADFAAGRDGGLTVEFDVAEGRQALVGAVRFEGDGAITRPELLAALRWQRPAAPFVIEDVAKDAFLVRRLYAARGFPYARVTPTTSPTGDGRHVDLVYAITEGPPATMGRLFVRGNFHTATDLVLRDFPLKRDAAYDAEAVDSYRDHLQGTGLPISRRIPRLFRSVDVNPAGYEENPVDVIVHVTEAYDDYGSIDAEFGDSSDQCLNETLSVDCLFVSLSYIDNNWLGRGFRLKVDGQTGLQLFAGHPLESRLVIADGTFSDPRTFGTYLRSDVTLFYRREDTIRLGLVQTEGARLTLTERVTDDLTLTGLYDVESINHPENATRPGGPLEGLQQVNIQTLVGQLTGSFLYDRRRVESGDDFLRQIAPDSGWYVEGAATVAHPSLWFLPGTGSEFAILHLQGGDWLPLPGGFLLGSGFSYDHGIPLGGASVLPKAEQFFAGGDTSMRGFLQDEFKRQVVQYEIPGAPGLHGYYVIPEGGNIRAIGHVELMHNFLVNWLVPFLLCDVGYLVDSYQGFAPSDIGESVGVGLRFRLPAGFASVEYATPIPDLGSDIPLGDVRGPTFGYLIPGHLYINFNYIY